MLENQLRVVRALCTGVIAVAMIVCTGCPKPPGETTVEELSIEASADQDTVVADNYIVTSGGDDAELKVPSGAMLSLPGPINDGDVMRVWLETDDSGWGIDPPEGDVLATCRIAGSVNGAPANILFGAPDEASRKAGTNDVELTVPLPADIEQGSAAVLYLRGDRTSVDGRYLGETKADEDQWHAVGVQEVGEGSLATFAGAGGTGYYSVCAGKPAVQAANREFSFDLTFEGKATAVKVIEPSTGEILAVMPLPFGWWDSEEQISASFGNYTCYPKYDPETGETDIGILSPFANKPEVQALSMQGVDENGIPYGETQTQTPEQIMSFDHDAGELDEFDDPYDDSELQGGHFDGNIDLDVVADNGNWNEFSQDVRGALDSAGFDYGIDRFSAIGDGYGANLRVFSNEARQVVEGVLREKGFNTNDSMSGGRNSVMTK